MPSIPPITVEEAEREAREILGYTSSSWLSLRSAAEVTRIAAALRKRDKAARSDERSKIAERLRARATSEQITADRRAPEYGEYDRAVMAAERCARVLREEADSLTSPEETGQ